MATQSFAPVVCLRAYQEIDGVEVPTTIPRSTLKAYMLEVWGQHLFYQDELRQWPKGIPTIEPVTAITVKRSHKPKGPPKEKPKRNPNLLSPAEAAAYLDMEESTLANWRSYGTGPKWRKHGGHVVYARATLDQWSEQQEA